MDALCLIPSPFFDWIQGILNSKPILKFGWLVQAIHDHICQCLSSICSFNPVSMVDPGRTQEGDGLLCGLQLARRPKSFSDQNLRQERRCLFSPCRPASVASLIDEASCNRPAIKRGFCTMKSASDGCVDVLDDGLTTSIHLGLIPRRNRLKDRARQAPFFQGVRSEFSPSVTVQLGHSVPVCQIPLHSSF